MNVSGAGRQAPIDGRSVPHPDDEASAVETVHAADDLGSDDAMGQERRALLKRLHELVDAGDGDRPSDGGVQDRAAAARRPETVVEQHQTDTSTGKTGAKRRRSWPRGGASQSEPAGREEAAASTARHSEAPSTPAELASDGPVSVADVVDGLKGLAAQVSGEVSTEPGTELLGPDVLGLRVIPEPLAALRGRDYSNLSVAQGIGFLQRMDMLSGATPTREEIDPANLDNNGDVEVLESDWPEEELAHWEGLGVARASLPDKRRIPLIMHAIWVGSPLRDDGGPRRRFMANFGAAATRFNNMLPVLWTDVPRAVIEQALETDAPAEGRDSLAGVREMVEWARERDIALVNVWEVANRDSPLDLQAFFAMEMYKLSGPGWAAASDILRVHLERFGGFYADGDEVVKDLSGLHHVLESPHGFAIQANERYDRRQPAMFVNNSALVLVKDHPFWRFYREQIRENYAETHDALFDRMPGVMRDFVQNNLDHPFARPRRYSTTWRTGPQLLRSLLSRIGYSEFPLFRGVTMGGSASWVPSGARPQPGHDQKIPADDLAGTVDMAAKLVHTLVRELFNRPGDVHLFAIEPALGRHENPDVALAGALRFISSRPELASLVRSVTNARWENGARRRFVLPTDVWDLLEPQPGRYAWRLGEGTFPVRMRSQEKSPGHAAPE